MAHSNKGSATVEACVVVPVFLFFMLDISYMFMMIMADAHIHQSLAEAAVYGAEYSYLEDRMMNVENTDNGMTGLFNTAIVYKQFRTYLGDDYMVDKVVAGGTKGIIITAQPDENNRKVYNVRADYYFMISVPIFGNRYIKKRECIKQKAFLGYSEDELNETDIYVYVTPNQSVYHMSRKCTHLALKVSSHAGCGSYPPCGFCGGDKYTGTVYIAENGQVYHNNPHCLGLKRTVLRVKKSSVEGLGPCSRCTR